MSRTHGPPVLVTLGKLSDGLCHSKLGDLRRYGLRTKEDQKSQYSPLYKRETFLVKFNPKTVQYTSGFWRSDFAIMRRTSRCGYFGLTVLSSSLFERDLTYVKKKSKITKQNNKTVEIRVTDGSS